MLLSLININLQLSYRTNYSKTVATNSIMVNDGRIVPGTDIRAPGSPDSL